MLLYVCQLYFRFNSISIIYADAGADANAEADTDTNADEDANADADADASTDAGAGWHAGEISKHLNCLTLSVSAMKWMG